MIYSEKCNLSPSMIFILYLSIDQGTEVNLSVVSNFLGSLHLAINSVKMRQVSSKLCNFALYI